MPRCYMVKKALCNKYINSVARGFESRGRGRSTPSPTNVRPVSPLEDNPYSVALQDLRLTGEKEDLSSSIERPPSVLLQRVQDVIENAIDQCTETGVEKSPKRRRQRGQDKTENASDQPSELEKSPKHFFHRVQDVIEGVIDQCNPPAVTTATPTVISCTGNVLQPAEFRASSSPKRVQRESKEVSLQRESREILADSFSAVQEKESTLRPESATSSKPSDVRFRPSSPVDSTRLEVLSPYKNPERFRSSFESPRSVIISKDYQNAEIPLFRDRSAAETEAAHDLLELSRSLPPLPQPSVAIGPQNVTESPSTDVQEMTVYQPAEQPVYQVNTILASDLGNSGIYQHHQTGIIYEPTATNATIIQQTPGGVFIPLSPVQEILFTYSAPSVPTSIISQQTIETVPPLTPPTSECSSDIENNNPNSQPSQRDKEVQTITEQSEVKAAAYTYDTLLVADGRSKNKKVPPQPKDAVEVEPIESHEFSKTGRYICCECGKQYATSSNLSRHKQTHRSIDSQSAKKCIYCGKAYVSMPALAMHVLTHKLTHSCGVCGKMFSRPWLLQGHLRSHTGEKPYGCAHCGKAFADRSNLRAHMQTHSADKNYECPRCRKSFALKSYLNKHLESACQRENGDMDDIDVSSS